MPMNKLNPTVRTEWLEELAQEAGYKCYMDFYRIKQADEVRQKIADRGGISEKLIDEAIEWARRKTSQPAHQEAKPENTTVLTQTE